MCRYFPTGTNILSTTLDRTKGVYAAAGEYQGKYVFAAVNVGIDDKLLDIALPAALDNASLYVYEEDYRKTNDDGHPIPVETAMSVGKSFKTTLKAQSFILLTNID